MRSTFKNLILVNFYPLGLRNCLFRNNSNDYKNAFYSNKEDFFNIQGNYFADEQPLFGRYNSKVLLNERRCLLGKKFVDLISFSIWISIKNFSEA